MPLIGVGAVILRDDCVLLVRRGHEPSKGQWSIPGGLVEVGETLAEAVAREVLEETGLVVKPRALIKTLERIFRDENGRVKYHYVLCDFLCDVISGQHVAASDADDVEFIPVEALERYGVAEITQQVIHEVVAPHGEGIYLFSD